MKRIIIICLLMIFTIHLLFSQIEKTEYKVIDSIEKKYSSFFDKKTATVNYRFILIRNMINNDSIKGIEIEVYTEDEEKVGSSVSLSSFGNNWGVSASSTFHKVEYGGVVFIKTSEAKEAFIFLNEVFPKIINTKPNFYELYKIKINERIEMGYFYEPDLNQWRYYTSVDNAIYDIEIYEGIQLIKKLRDFSRN